MGWVNLDKECTGMSKDEELMSALKVRLKLKFLTRKIDYYIHLNFGYCPKNKIFDMLVDERRHYESIAEKHYPSIHEHHCNMSYNGNRFSYAKEVYPLPK